MTERQWAKKARAIAGRCVGPGVTPAAWVRWVLAEEAKRLTRLSRRA
jgi:hypothetical protein